MLSTLLSQTFSAHAQTIQYTKVKDAKLLSSLFLKDMHKVYAKSDALEGDLLLSPDFAVFDEDLSMVIGDKKRIDEAFSKMMAFGDAKGSDEDDPCWGMDPDSDGVQFSDTMKAIKTRGQLIDFAKGIKVLPQCSVDEFGLI